MCAGPVRHGQRVRRGLRGAGERRRVEEVLRERQALGETGKGTANFFIVIGIIETVALFTLVFSLLLLQ